MGGGGWRGGGGNSFGKGMEAAKGMGRSDASPTYRRVPGLPPTGRSARRSQRRDTGGGAAAGVNQAVDPRLVMPGVLDATTVRRGAPAEAPSAAGSSTDGVGKPNGAGEARDGVGEGGGGGGGARSVVEAPVHGAALEPGGVEHGGHANAARAEAPQPADLPPLRGWRVPTVPRAAIQREADAAAQRLGHLKALGAKPRRLERAEKRKEDAEQKLKVAGGPTSRSLLWQIKSEEDKIDQAQKAIDREKKERADKAEQVAKLQAEIAASEALEQRLCERRAEATERLHYLTNQKWVENMPPAWVEQFRVLERTLGETGHQAHSMVQVLLGLMVLPAEDMDITLGDSDSDGRGSGTDAEGECSSSGTKPEEDDLERGDCNAAGMGTQLFLDTTAVRTYAGRRRSSKMSGRVGWKPSPKRRRPSGSVTGQTSAPGKVTLLGGRTWLATATWFPPSPSTRWRTFFAPKSMSRRLSWPGCGEEMLRGCRRWALHLLGGASPRKRGPSVGDDPWTCRGETLPDLLCEGVAPGRTRRTRRQLRRRGQGRGTHVGPPSALVGEERGLAPLAVGGGPSAGGAGGGRPGASAASVALKRGPTPEALRMLSESAEEGMRKVREVARDLNRKAVAKGEEVMQERMQALQEKEAARAAAVKQAKEEIESRISTRDPVEGEAATIEGWPAYGPTGQRLDEHQRILLRTARPRSAGAACSDTEMVGGGVASEMDEVSGGRENLPAAFRGSRWRTVRADASVERARERSPRPGLPAFLRGRGR